MRYFALYQRTFSGVPRPLEIDSHVFVDYTSADDLEAVFAAFRAEAMTETRRCRVLCRNVRHLSMSVGDAVIGEDGFLYAVMPVGFARAGPMALEARAELALHLLSLGLEGTPGWAALFEADPPALTARVARRLAEGSHGTARAALAPHPFPPTGAPW